jgi:hypothetical protein
LRHSSKGNSQNHTLREEHTMTTNKPKNGIIFDKHSIAAILAGNKTQTRRVMKAAGKLECLEYDRDPLEPHYYGKTWHNRYGKPGDLLYVKETVWHKGDEVAYDEPHEGGWQKVNALFMPRDLSRLTLHITGHRLEHLNHITVADVIAEGITVGKGETVYETKLFDLFRQRWDSINAKRGYPFDKNSPVRVIEFEVYRA